MKNKIILSLLGIGFATYAYRFQFYGINLSVLRVIGLFLILMYALKILKIFLIKTSLKRKDLIILTLFSLIALMNYEQYLSISGYAGLQNEIATHLFNIVMCLSIVSFIDTENKFRLAIKLYVMSSIVALGVAYYAYFFGDIPFVWLIQEFGSMAAQHLSYLNVNDGLIRLTGPFVDPNFYGIYLVTIIIFSLWLYRYQERSIIYPILIILSLVSLPMTISRTAMVGFSIFCFLYILLDSKKKSLYGTLYAISLLSLIVAYILGGRTERVFDATSWHDRLHFQETAWNAFCAHPIFGSGTLSILDRASGDATGHMVYLTLLAKYGLVGATFYLLLIFAPLLMAIRKSRFERKYRNLIFYIYTPLAVMYIAYDFLTFLEFEYFLFAVGYSIVFYHGTWIGQRKPTRLSCPKQTVVLRT